MAIVDFDGDNVLDFVVPAAFLGGVLLFHGNGDGSFTEVPPIEAGLSPLEVRIADLNNDGRDDVAVANADDNSIAVFVANGSGLDPALFFDNGASGAGGARHRRRGRRFQARHGHRQYPKRDRR